MLIRDIERPFLSRVRSAKDSHPLRKTAEGLGVFLDRLSEAVGDADTVDSVLHAQRRGGSARGFKFPAPQYGEEAAAVEPAVDFNLTEEEAEAFDALREARDIASDATNIVVPLQDRMVSQERLQALLLEVKAKGINILSDMLNERASESENGSFFSIATPDAARAAYSGIDEMIMRFLNAGRQDVVGGVTGADSPYIDHGAAISAAEQLRDFLLAEGPAKAFARFREVNRSNVLGLLQ